MKRPVKIITPKATAKNGLRALCKNLTKEGFKKGSLKTWGNFRASPVMIIAPPKIEVVIVEALCKSLE